MTNTLRLFVVEDDDDIALLIGKALERAGHKVTRCRTAADALIVLGHRQFDLVLLDHRLPDMAGLDLLDALSREGITTPALMVTAFGDEQLATRVLRAGALDYVVKDPDLKFLLDLPKRAHESVTRHRLQHMNRLLIEALESAHDGIMITDLHGTILYVNQALERMTGYSREELCGQNPRMLKNAGNPLELYADLWHTVLARASWQGELTNRRKDGGPVEISLTVSPIVDSRGQLTHFVGIQRDITERKLLERQLLQAQKMQSVGTLAGGVAHEFNNLLAGINGYASLGLRESGLPEAAQQFFQQIVELSERAASLTRQLLAFARKPALVRRPTSIRDLVSSTAELIARTLHAEVTLDVTPEDAEADKLLVAGDANQLQQVLVNLALNARDAKMEEPAQLAFRVRPHVMAVSRSAFPENVPAGDYILTEVRDEGCGMTPEVLNQALDPFFTTKPVGQGTGLGLSTVFGIVRGHQGYLSIETEPGKGTCVGIYLPRLLDPNRLKEDPGFEAGQVVEPEAVPGCNILVVDDEAAVLDVVRRFLEIAGHTVTCTSTVTEAATLVKNGGSVNLVILDLMMPREESMSSLQFRERQPQLPVLLCTGLLDTNLIPDLVGLGSISLLRKPFRMNQLWYAVNQALGEANRSETSES